MEGSGGSQEERLQGTLYHGGEGPERGRGRRGKGERVIEGPGGFVCENGGSEERDLTRQGTNILGASSLLGGNPHATGDTPRTAAPIGFTGGPHGQCTFAQLVPCPGTEKGQMATGYLPSPPWQVTPWAGAEVPTSQGHTTNHDAPA